MYIELPQNVQTIIRTLNTAGHEAYAVGGCVRDTILGRIPEDWDITTSAHPDEVKHLFGRSVDTGIEHGTVTVLLPGGSYEVTTYRIDGTYSDGRHPDGVTFTPSLAEDLRRRDFTVNAMAYHPKTGIVDPYDGMGDLSRHVIRAVGNPAERFSEDALRMLRAVRFSAQLDFVIDPRTSHAVEALSQRLSLVSAERIRTELEKLLVSDHPEKIRDAYELGLTAVFLPEFDRMMETPQNTPHHCYSVGEHTICALCHIRPDRILRTVMLLHDIAKPDCRTTDQDGRDHFKKHMTEGAQLSSQIMRRLRYDNDTRKRVCRFVRWHDERPALTQEAVRRYISRAGTDLFPEMFEVKTADTLAQSTYKREEKLEAVAFYRETWQTILEERQCVSVGNLALSGADLLALGIPQGPRIGETLQELLETVLEDPDRNTKPFLSEYIREKQKGGTDDGCEKSI